MLLREGGYNTTWEATQSTCCSSFKLHTCQPWTQLPPWSDRCRASPIQRLSLFPLRFRDTQQDQLTLQKCRRYKSQKKNTKTASRHTCWRERGIHTPTRSNVKTAATIAIFGVVPGIWKAALVIEHCLGGMHDKSGPRDRHPKAAVSRPTGRKKTRGTRTYIHISRIVKAADAWHRQNSVFQAPATSSYTASIGRRSSLACAFLLRTNMPGSRWHQPQHLWLISHTYLYSWFPRCELIFKAKQQPAAPCPTAAPPQPRKCYTPYLLSPLLTAAARPDRYCTASVLTRRGCVFSRPRLAGLNHLCFGDGLFQEIIQIVVLPRCAAAALYSFVVEVTRIEYSATRSGSGRRVRTAAAAAANEMRRQRGGGRLTPLLASTFKIQRTTGRPIIIIINKGSSS